MIVVADTGPVHYLVLINAIGVLRPLYSRVLVPLTVAEELKASAAPSAVMERIAQPPRWFEILADPPADPKLAFLDPGERAAISLALSVNAERLLIDEWNGRVEAERRHLFVTGTLGVLVDAHRAGLLQFESALNDLRQTNFYLSAELIDRVRRLITGHRDIA